MRNMPPLSRRDFLAASTGLALAGVPTTDATAAVDDTLEPLPVPDWVWQTTRMCFASSGEIDRAVKSGAQVLHTNLVWPYFPLRRDGGGLSPSDDAKLKELVSACHRAGPRLGLGLPPFPPVSLVKQHPDWRVHPDATAAVLKVEPVENNLGTRLGCNLGPWGDYLIEVCGELVQDYQIDAFSFDGNYHAALCHCAACGLAYQKEKGRTLPPRINLDDIAYREYLAWRGAKLEDHYHKLQRRIKTINPEAVIMTWTVNAGRYGHFLHSPRAMPTRLNRQFDAAMQEWWLDETNFGGSVAPAFGAAYLRTVLCGRPAASEPYLMSRGNPYGTDSFPAHERLTRTLLAVTNGCITAESLGWPGHAKSAEQSLAAVKERAPWLTRATPLPWCAILVSEQTRQFYAYKDIAERFLPHIFGVFRAGLEEHLPVTLINDWDLNDAELGKYAVLVLPNAAALSESQLVAVRSFVKAGGGLVASGEASLCDDLGRPRGDFALADVFGIHYQGRPSAPLERPKLDPNFAIAIDDNYWKQRTGLATLTWSDHPFFQDGKLQELVPSRSTRFRGPLVKVSEPTLNAEVIATMQPDGLKPSKLTAIALNKYGQGQVVYLAACVDAALWSYAYPYQRRLLVRLIEGVSRTPPPLRVEAPMCVQASASTQQTEKGLRLVVHLFNGLNTTANHGLPSQDVPLREETVPVHGIKVRLLDTRYQRFECQPGNRSVKLTREGDALVIELPALELHQMLVGET